jgi:hypothetical protein
MPIVTTDIVYRLSGGAANTSPAASLGGAMSTAGGGVITSGAANNLWDDVSGAESLSGDTEYRGFYVRNECATAITLQSPVVWIDVQTTSPDTSFEIAVAAEAASVAMASIANESTAPATVVFTTPATKGAGLALTNLAQNAYRGIWIKRIVTASAAAANDSGSIRVEGDTAP